MGVNFFGEVAPDDFGSYDLAFITVFSMTAGNSWVGVSSSPQIYRILPHTYGCKLAIYEFAQLL